MNAQMLADRAAIHDVMLTYAAGVDDRDFDQYRSVFCDDVVVIGFADTTLTGADAVIDFVRSALAGFGPTQHLTATPLVSIHGDTAHARTDIRALHELNEPAGQLFTLWGKYETDLVRTAGGWKIRRHELVARLTRTVAA